MNLKVEDTLKSLSRTDPAPKVGILGHIPRCSMRNKKNLFAAIPRLLAARKFVFVKVKFINS